MPYVGRTQADLDRHQGGHEYRPQVEPRKKLQRRAMKSKFLCHHSGERRDTINGNRPDCLPQSRLAIVPSLPAVVDNSLFPVSLFNDEPLQDSSLTRAVESIRVIAGEERTTEMSLLLLLPLLGRSPTMRYPLMRQAGWVRSGQRRRAVSNAIKPGFFEDATNRELEQRKQSC